jgi:hypothetical protein
MALLLKLLRALEFCPTVGVYLRILSAILPNAQPSNSSWFSLLSASLAAASFQIRFSFHWLSPFGPSKSSSYANR